MSRETEALVVRQIGGPFTMETIKLDSLRGDEALIEIHATGICHTDLSCANGILPTRFPAVFGHEGAGIVVDIGSEITEVGKGDKVLLSYAFCSTCYQCTTGHPPYCEKLLELNFGGRRVDGTSGLSLDDGGTLHGHFFGQSSFSRFAIVNRRSLVKLPDEVSLELFAPLGCGMQTGAGAVLNTLNVKAGSTVAVFGTGSVGLSAVMACRMRGAAITIAVDIHESRLILAKDLGATHTINSSNTDVIQEIKKICPRLDFAVDCSGIPQVIESMLDSLGTRGRACSVGAPSPGKRASVDVFSHVVMGKEYVGCHQGESIASEMAMFLIDQYSRGMYPLEKLVTVYNVESHAVAMRDMKEGRTIKAVLKWK